MAQVDANIAAAFDIRQSQAEAVVVGANFSRKYAEKWPPFLFLDIYIPVKRLRLRGLCLLFNEILQGAGRVREQGGTGRPLKYHIYVVDLRNTRKNGQEDVGNPSRDPLRGSTQKLVDLCQFDGVSLSRREKATTMISVVSDIPSLPPEYERIRPDRDHHAAVDRVRQTWDYVHILRKAASNSEAIGMAGQEPSNPALQNFRNYVLIIEDDAGLCPTFFPLLSEAVSLGDKSQGEPLFIGGFGGAALGYPASILRRLANYLQYRMRDSNLDVLISKGVSHKWPNVFHHTCGGVSENSSNNEDSLGGMKKSADIESGCDNFMMRDLQQSVAGGGPRNIFKKCAYL